MNRIAPSCLIALVTMTACQSAAPQRGDPGHPAAASEPAASAKPAPHVPASPAAFLDVPLVYTVPDPAVDGGVRTIHTPMVAAKFSGTETLLIIDSGATDHVFTRALGEKVGAAFVETEPGTDHAGAPVRSFVMDGEFTLSIDGAKLGAQKPIAIEGPPPFAGWGIGGFLSPQQLDPTAILVLDLRAARLKLFAAEGRADEQVDERWDRICAEVKKAHPDLDEVAAERVTAEGDEARLVIVEATLEGGTSLHVMLNSGGRHAEISPSALGEELGEVKASGRGVSGTAVKSRKIEGRAFRFGEGAIVPSSLMVREQSGAFGAQLGIEPLTGVVIAVHPDANVPVRLWLPRVRQKKQPYNDMGSQ